MNWHGNRLNERFIYREVDFSDLSEGADIEDVAGGGLDFGAFTDLKASGTLSFFGRRPDDSKLVRVYYTFTDDDGETLDPYCLGTFFVEPRDIANAYTIDGIIEQGSVDLKSVLCALNGDILGMPQTVSEGTNAITAAISECTAHGLKTEAQESSYTLPKDKLFDASDTYSKKVNELLSAAGFRAAMPSAQGSVLFQDATLGTSPVFTFEAGEYSITEPKVTETSNWTDGFNCWKAYYADEDVSLYAEAVITDGTSNSYNRIHRLKTDSLQVDSLSGADASTMLANLMLAVQTKAQDNTGSYEYVKFSHPWIPMELYDCAAVDFGERKWIGNLANRHIDLSVGADTSDELRRPVQGDATIHVKGIDLITGSVTEYDV